MDTMGVIWLMIHGTIIIVATWKLASAHRAKDSQKHNDNNACYINRVSELKQRFSGIIASTASDTIDNDRDDNTENCDADNGYPHSTSIAGGK